MYKKGLICIPTHGFGNRMRMICTCYILSKEWNIPLYVHWQKDETCNFDPCITSLNFINEINTENYYYKGYVHTKDYYHEYIANGNNYDYLIITGGHEFCSPKLDETTFIKLKHEFYSSLKFTDEITQYKLNFKYVAIHYRWFDKKFDTDDGDNFDTSLKQIEDCVNTLNIKLPIVIITNNKTIKFNIHNDNENNNENLIYDYKNVSNNKNVNENENDNENENENENDNENDNDNDKVTNNKNVNDKNVSDRTSISDVVDFYILCNSEFIIGSFYSSFSDEAIWMNNISKVIPYKGNKEYHCYGIYRINPELMCINEYSYELYKCLLKDNLKIKIYNPYFDNSVKVKKNTILLLVDKVNSIFSNGCIQQAYFIYKLLKHTKWNVELASIYTDYNKFDVTDIPVRSIPYGSNLDDVFLVIGISASITSTLLFALHGIKVVNLNCGNLFILHQEDYLFNVHKLLQQIPATVCDEIWTFPMYTHSVDYFKLIYHKPVHVMPYIWSPDIIQQYIDMNDMKDLTYKYDEKKPYNLAIFEPNLSIHKTSLIPIFIGNEIYEKTGDVKKMFVFCTNNKTTFVTETLKNIPKVPIEYQPRMPLAHALKALKDLGDNIVILSHNIMNDLNFIHLELMYLKYPIIHNCQPFDVNGLYYENGHEMNAVELFSSKHAKYVPDCSELFRRYSPDNSKNIKTYVRHIQRLENTINYKHVFNIKDYKYKLGLELKNVKESELELELKNIKDSKLELELELKNIKDFKLESETENKLDYKSELKNVKDNKTEDIKSSIYKSDVSLTEFFAQKKTFIGNKLYIFSDKDNIIKVDSNSENMKILSVYYKFNNNIVEYINVSKLFVENNEIADVLNYFSSNYEEFIKYISVEQLIIVVFKIFYDNINLL
jgi:hypothetical protein